MKNKLNFGCGHTLMDGYDNLDIKDFDFNIYPYPIVDNYYDYIYAESILEHLRDTDNTMRELHRILKPGGKLLIIVPHYLGIDAWSHPQHYRAFTTDTFSFYTRGTKRYITYPGQEETFNFSKIKIQVIYDKSKNPITWLNYLIEPIANINLEVSERILFNLFRPSHIEFLLRK